jgi:acyl-CoA thioester hydrolase
MYVHESAFRVLYAHTDKAGVVYYGTYLEIFESGRSEHFRALGKSYRDFERDGILLTVTEAHLRYRGPAHYDDLLTVRTWIGRVRRTRIDYVYEVLDPNRDIICEGSTLLGCIDAKTLRPRALPDDLMAMVTAAAG